jgi:hypothetical protein
LLRSIDEKVAHEFDVEHDLGWLDRQSLDEDPMQPRKDGVGIRFATACRTVRIRAAASFESSI